jgi:hypothetical protein
MLTVANEINNLNPPNIRFVAMVDPLWKYGKTPWLRRTTGAEVPQR